MSHIHLIKKENYGIIQMDREKANPMNYEFVAGMRIALKNLLEDDSIHGAIINGKENFFSAGLDLPELYTYDQLQFEKFWKNFMELVCDIVAFDKPLIASINGHSPAGGCILAIGCDYRVMAEGNYKIGLNEIPIGIVVPRGIFDIYSFWIGRKRAYQYLMEGKLYSPEHAKEIGLVDEVVSADKVLETAEIKLKQYLKFEQHGWRITKRQLKFEQLKTMSSISDFEMNAMLQQWWSEPVRTIVGQFVENLKKKD
ncbi:MAG TPA: enoyl-CoA hydratase/isomerase family protein [Chitinophagales bacterium]|jgi:3,2-trans-enoyl-CoA isomerase|nr:enoyl-CoA hydratase/isomerase family protein [Chitinophagales bacterium]MBP6154595.1 enoyl-CoA hydratase/isomerase family protein [Chitinophagales bacterium]HQV77265.1 enoyl-CoA hydratase/isomerase family protein [Chitinophagales bacterium]HQW78326.1 enoyl-CoA hydratase/isomerase family protein [Chitinophagales bacterium]HRB67766.1 enoyl-CoA hydratase/isomerase family protein [Chitinophagales bacterium]